jgi:hypothetical protein
LSEANVRADKAKGDRKEEALAEFGEIAKEEHSIGFKSNKPEECVPMSGKIAR